MTDAWTAPEADPAALRYELDGLREELARLRAALSKIVTYYETRPEARVGGAVAIAVDALGGGLSEPDQADELRGLLAELVDPEECWYDHHGLCQAHGLDPAPCPHTRARQILGGGE